MGILSKFLADFAESQCEHQNDMAGIDPTLHIFPNLYQRVLGN
jgi:hypothetical protein